MSTKILCVNLFYDRQLGGGTAERNFQLSKLLREKKFRAVNLVTNYGQFTSVSYPNTVVLPIIFKRFYVPRFSIIRLIFFIKKFNYIHLMGHWSFLNAFVYFVARYYKIPYMVCPAGALGIYGRSKILKILYNFLIGKKIINNASAKIAISSSEYKSFLDYTVSQENINLIPNGINIPSQIKCNHDYTLTNKLPAKFLLFMGRLDYIKGPDLLLEAFIKINHMFPDLYLIYAGQDFGMRGMLEEKSSIYHINHRVIFFGYADGCSKESLYRSAKLLVVPSRSEAMSIVALEAGSYGLPALVTSACGFHEVKEINRLLECDSSVDSIAEHIKNLLSGQAQLSLIGDAFKSFVIQNYTWQSIIKKYIAQIQRI